MIRSIRSQAQIYYGGLVLVLVALILAGFNYYERASRLKVLDQQLNDEMVLALPLFFTSPGPKRPPHPEGERDFPRPKGEKRFDEERKPPPDGEVRNAARPPPPRDGDGPPPRRGPGPGGFRNSEGGRELTRRLEGEGLYLLGYDPQGKEIFKTGNAPVVSRELATRRFTRNFKQWKGENREAIHFAPDQGYLVLGRNASGLHEGLDDLMWRIGSVSVLLTGIVLALGWVLMGRALKPISEITKVAQGISDGDSSRRIDTNLIRNELGELGGILNTTFDRLVKTLQQQIRITADASHELRTPVSVILADCDLALRKDCSSERRLETLELCRETALHMKQLIEALTQMARWDSRSGVLNKEGCDLKELADQVGRMLMPLADRKDVTLRVEGEPCQVECDALAMRQTIANLVSNAIDYNRPQGKVTILVSSDREWNTVEVQDTGEGISVDELSQIFERFYRVDKARDIGDGHSGLGLSICKAIVDAHGGRLNAQSVKGKGSRFVIELPKS